MKWIVLAVSVALVGAVMFSRMAAPKGYEKLAMSVNEMKATGALIVDIRTPQEWKDTGVIAGAKLVTFGDADGFLKAVGKDLSDGRPLILVCRSGNRSAAAAAALAGKIPNRIISANGGMSAAIAAGAIPVFLYGRKRLGSEWFALIGAGTYLLHPAVGWTNLENFHPDAFLGVFVGFAALIAVRSVGPTEPLEVAPMRVLVSMAMLTILAALAPVALDRYDLTDHQVWALGSALILGGWLLFLVVSFTMRFAICFRCFVI